ncbi:hypothetical protein BJ508DRAFT_419452 [Ascobolus immersus RN42]|uniref:CBM-cenC domain-containing protein n=1 Tax=Ascobolus immersus RN42 TaxID=1160509 RepID=A0A3N4HDY8_ASCIM|nr:hypothetical protein BJ508DRAFT_419452 [Ascobolus immersus RN42]
MKFSALTTAALLAIAASSVAGSPLEERHHDACRVKTVYKTKTSWVPKTTTTKTRTVIETKTWCKNDRWHWTKTQTTTKTIPTTVTISKTTTQSTTIIQTIDADTITSTSTITPEPVTSTTTSVVTLDPETTTITSTQEVSPITVTSTSTLTPDVVTITSTITEPTEAPTPVCTPSEEVPILSNGNFATAISPSDWTGTLLSPAGTVMLQAARNHVCYRGTASCPPGSPYGDKPIFLLNGSSQLNSTPNPEVHYSLVQPGRYQYCVGTNDLVSPNQQYSFEAAVLSRYGGNTCSVIALSGGRQLGSLTFETVDKWEKLGPWRFEPAAKGEVVELRLRCGPNQPGGHSTAVIFVTDVQVTKV